MHLEITVKKYSNFCITYECKFQVITFLVINAQRHHFKLELGIIERTPSIQSIFEIGYYCKWNFFLAFQIAFDRGL
jgi:hypothetical protein